MWRSQISTAHYRSILNSSVAVQRVFRGYLFKQKLKNMALSRLTVSAVIIQKAWRLYDCSTNYFLVLAYLIMMQSIVRQYQAKRNFFATKSSIVAIQNLIRLCYIRKKQRRMLSLRHNSACLIQHTWRLYDCSSNYYLVMAYVIVAQCAVRRFLVKEKILEMAMNAEESKNWNASCKVQCQDSICMAYHCTL
jgi:myosin heavy subunit